MLGKSEWRRREFLQAAAVAAMGAAGVGQGAEGRGAGRKKTD